MSYPANVAMETVGYVETTVEQAVQPIMPYEYDEFYNTRVNRAWVRSILPAILGAIFIILGIGMIIFTAIDISRGVTAYTSQNPNYIGSGTVNTKDNLPASWNENSIWPTMGKGIWVGLLVRSIHDDTFVQFYFN